MVTPPPSSLSNRYIPAFWHHRVAQRGETVAVNYWHDANFASASFVMWEYVKAEKAERERGQRCAANLHLQVPK
mgnify:FL=1